MLYEDYDSGEKYTGTVLGARLRKTLSKGFDRIAETLHKSSDEIKESFSLLRENLRSFGMQEQNKSAREMLECCYGESVYIAELSFTEIVRWLQGRKEGCGTIIFRLDDKRLNELLASEAGHKLSLDGEKYVIAAVLDGNNMKDSLLIRYETLDSQLEDIFSKGDIVMQDSQQL